MWNNLISHKLSCFSWRLLLWKTPTDSVAMQKGCSLASRCYSCHSYGESDIHFFFSFDIAQQLWHWLLGQGGTSLAPPLSASSVWAALVQGIDVKGRKSAAIIFLQAIHAHWFIRNEAKHHSKSPSLMKTQMVFLDRMRGTLSSVSGSKIPPHPVLRSFGWTY